MKGQGTLIRGDNSDESYIDDFSTGSEQISTIPCTEHPWVNSTQVCLNEGPHPV